MKNPIPTRAHKQFLASASVAMVCLLMAISSPATTRTVTTLADGGAGSLRATITDSLGGDSINFSLGGTITLTSGELAIGRNLTITGPGARNLVVNGGNNSRVFEILSSATVSISGLTISNGLAQGAASTTGDGGTGQGGGILNAGTLTLTACTITYNTAVGGVGADMAGYGGNGFGGGICSTGYVAMTGCTVCYNYAQGPNGNNSDLGQGEGCGGGLFLSEGGFLLINCTIANNVALGELSNVGSPAGDGVGGGIYVGSASGSNFISCTISGNGCQGGSSYGSLGGDGLGGGIYSSNGFLIENTIVSGNEVAGGTGGVDEDGISEGPDVYGSVNSGGFNLVGQADGSSGFTGGEGPDLTGFSGAPLDPQLGPLQFNGGATPTMALAPASAALDQGFSESLSTDQRGSQRTYDFTNIPNAIFTFDGLPSDGADIGAYELLPNPPLLGITSNFSGMAAYFGALAGAMTSSNGGIMWSNNSPGTGSQSNAPSFKLQRLILAPGISFLNSNWMDFPSPVRSISNYIVARESFVGAGSIYRLVTGSNTSYVPAPATQPATQITGGSATLNGTAEPVGSNTLYWFVYGTDTNYALSTPKTSQGNATNPITLSYPVSGLNSLTLYHFQLVVMDDWATLYGGDQTFNTGAPPPTLVTLSASSVTGSSAVLNGTMNGNGANWAAYFEYGTDTSYGNTTYNSQQYGSGYATTEVSTGITGLSPGTTYHYRIIGFNTTGEGFGLDTNFTTAGPQSPPTVATLAASSVTTSSAQVNGTVNPNGASSTVYFEYGTTTSYGSVTTQTGVNSSESFSATLSGLASSTTYHYRIDAFNSGGTSYGSDFSFTTAWAPVPPTLVSPGTTTDTGSTVFNLAPAFSWSGASQASSYNLTISLYPAGTTVLNASGLTGTSYQLPNGYLQSGTAYSWFMNSVNSLGNQSANSSPLYFQTASLPTVQTTAATSVGENSAHLNGTVNPNGSSTTVYFQYGTNTSYGSITTQTGIGTTSENFSATVTGLNLYQTYHYRIVAVNGIGASYGADMNFFTE